SYWTHRALEEIKANPGGWLRLIAKKSWLTLWNAEVPNNKAFAFLQKEFVWLRVPPVRWVILLVLAPAGLWLAWKRGQRAALFILFFYAAIYSASNVAFFICDRYRYPVWPVMAALAGGGLLAFVDAIRARRNKQIVVMFASMVVLAALSLHNWFDAKLATFARDYLFRSFACYDKGLFPDALNDINHSLELDPTDVNALHHRGNVLFALGKLDEARVAYEQTLQRAPEESSTWNNLGTTLDKMGRTDDAIKAFQRATECRPPSKNAFFGMALIQIRLHRLDDAATTVDRFEKQAKNPDAVMTAVSAAIAKLRGDAALAASLESKARSLDAAATAWAMEQIVKTTQR
ncbi:MAG: tetratricopeptide repeat protein, partial [Verrucomicrobia bacterium]